jgi:glycosyltransferase involved in cell wall biosynthesis
MPALISICIPTYKNTVSLRRLLTSIRDQDFQDFEVVICDDTPNQDVWEIICDFAEIPGLRYEQNNPRLGSPANWNRCLALAKGEWIKIMHHDDWFSSPDSLRSFAEATEVLSGSPFLFSGCNAFRNGEHFAFRHCPFGDDGGIQPLLELACHDLIFANRIGCPSVTMFRNGCGLQFDESLLWLVDVDFYLTAIASAGSVVLKRTLINVTFSADTQITSTVEADPSLRWRETLYLCEKHRLLSLADVRTRLVRESEGISWADLRGYRHRFQAMPTTHMRSLTQMIMLRISLHRLAEGLQNLPGTSRRWIEQTVHKLIRFCRWVLVERR